MRESDVVAISRQGVFSLEEAKGILPVIKKITQEYSQDVDYLIARLEAIESSQLDIINELESEINDQIQAWHSKVRKLGGAPKGLWLVDFDAGDGYFCWKYPEPDILYWHSYTDGFTKRMPVAERDANHARGPSSNQFDLR